MITIGKDVKSSVFLGDFNDFSQFGGCTNQIERVISPRILPVKWNRQGERKNGTP
jgi:hypothetical protein